MKRRGQQRGQERGQSLIEATFVLLVFFGLLLGVIDCGQVVLAHESLVERVRSSVRWGVVHPWGGGEQIVNLVLYNQTAEPRMSTVGYLGLRPENVVVRYQAPTAERPDDETLSVNIVKFESHFYSPWMAGTLISPRPVSVTAPMAYKTPLAASN